MLATFDELVRARSGDGAEQSDRRRLRDLLPTVLRAGDDAGVLTLEGAAWLDPSGALGPGAPACPPEGDAGTGMVATNAVAERTGNISAGTSVFAMFVLERPLSKVYPEIDMVTTPEGRPVAMVHCNNCASEIDAWAEVFRGFAEAAGTSLDDDTVYGAMYGEALKGDGDAGGLIVYNYLAGEPITDFDEGRPLVARSADSRLSFANFTRALLYSAVATLKIGMGILENEKVRVDRVVGHGGLFKTGHAGQRIMAAALGAPVSVMETAGEGGAWGIALLAAYRADKAASRAGTTGAAQAERSADETNSARATGADDSLGAWLDKNVFAEMTGVEAAPDPDDARGFATFLARYVKGLAVERAAVENIDTV
ncbi:MAG: ATPase, partial [Clostridiales Family XIII bacterium]|jgi:sugar (pentulose or hexulose) kinase|nr:ATPase [Clostridiales Family XIII bacterium]